MTHYISLQQTHFAVYRALAGLLTYYAGLLPAHRKINTAGSTVGQLLSRIHHDSRQQPEVMSAVPDLVHLPRGDGSPLFILPKGVQLWGKKQKKMLKEAGLKVLSSLKPGSRCFPQHTHSFSGLVIKLKINLSHCCFCTDALKARGKFYLFIKK